MQHLRSYVGQARVEIHSARAQLDLLLANTPHDSNAWAPTRAAAITAQRRLDEAMSHVQTIAGWLPNEP
jgi:hypothetical protein